MKSIKIIQALGLLGWSSVANASEPVTYIIDATGEPALAILHYRPSRTCKQSGGDVLYLHGATFPAELSIGFKIDGHSWADSLNDECFNVWALNFAGYGNSEDYTHLNRAEYPSSTPGQSGEVQRQIERAVDFIGAQSNRSKVSIIAHSWGTIAAGEFAANQPGRVDKLVLFGPIAQRQLQMPAGTLAANHLVTIEHQHQKLVRDTPAEHPAVYNQARFDQWGEMYLDTDPTSRTRSPASVAVPTGPLMDLRAAWSGKFPYDPSEVTAKILLIRGEWDSFSHDADIAWLARSFTDAKSVEEIKLPKGGHLMHLEHGRIALHESVNHFLKLETGKR